MYARKHRNERPLEPSSHRVFKIEGAQSGGILLFAGLGRPAPGTTRKQSFGRPEISALSFGRPEISADYCTKTEQMLYQNRTNDGAHNPAETETERSGPPPLPTKHKLAHTMFIKREPAVRTLGSP